MKTLTGKVALVTGGSRGLGAATALALAGQGANVAISYVVAKERAEGVVRGIDALGVRGASFQADQGDPVAASAVVDRTVDRFGRIDILVSNASVDAHGSVADPNRDQPTFDHFWSVALAGYMATVRAAAKVISEDGRIVMIGSNLGTRTGSPGFADLAAVKGAIDGFARGVARDLASRRVTVNVVHSGIMDTEIHGDAGESAFKSFFSTLCFPRFARIEEVVAPILFFASPVASFITGSSIDADGGFNA
jgi:3-oxoacyl-[acyl-carrier protein] reductase